MADDVLKLATPDNINKAAALLADGKLVSFPTETVYGLGADAHNDKAVASIFTVKGRPQFNPLIVHVASLQDAHHYGQFDPLAISLAKSFWPGALTLVVPLREDSGLSSLVTAGLETVALRVPDHDVALDLLVAFRNLSKNGAKNVGGGLAAPSANPSGQLSPTEAEHVEDHLGQKVDLILDGDACLVGVESTIISVLERKVTLLRSGRISPQMIERVIGQNVETGSQTKVLEGHAFTEKQDVSQDASQIAPSITPQIAPLSPGQLESHYAPKAQLRLNQSLSHKGEMMLAFGADAPQVLGLNLSPSADLAEAAMNLYAYLHILDDTGVEVINVMPIPQKGIGIALNDRLSRAATPRGD